MKKPLIVVIVLLTSMLASFSSMADETPVSVSFGISLQPSRWEGENLNGGTKFDASATQLQLNLNIRKANFYGGLSFQGAEFELDGKIYHADVEIHRNINDWYHHHHHLDRRYNSVRLHLVWNHQPDLPIFTYDDQQIITLDIKKLSRSIKARESNAFCHISDLSNKRLRDNLKYASLKRLKYKITHMKDLVSSCSYDQVIYILLMRILGSPNNAKNFERMALVLPWENMIEIKNKYCLSREQWKILYFHLSGLKKISYRSLSKTDNDHLSSLMNKIIPLPDINWQTAGQRPRNSPIFHLSTLANWFTVFSNDSLYFTLKEIIIQRFTQEKLTFKLQEVLSFSRSVSEDKKNIKIQKEPVTSWGKSIINEIIGNVIIPFFYWEASLQSSFGFQKYLEEYYFTLPQFNQYAKLMKLKLLLAKNHLSDKKFYIDQGLLYLYHHYCKREDCQICPMAEQPKDIDKNF